MNSLQTSLNNFETKNKQYWNKIRKQMTNIYLNKVDDNNEVRYGSGCFTPHYTLWNLHFGLF